MESSAGRPIEVSFSLDTLHSPAVTVKGVKGGDGGQTSSADCNCKFNLKHRSLYEAFHNNSKMNIL